jgi:hypothetical protein
MPSEFRNAVNARFGASVCCDDFGQMPKKKNEGDVMTEAGTASVFDASSIEIASSSVCSFPATFRSFCFFGAFPDFLIASAPPASALLCEMGDGASPSCN